MALLHEKGSKSVLLVFRTVQPTGSEQEQKTDLISEDWQQVLLLSSKLALYFQPLKNDLGYMHDNRHDDAPKPRNINDIPVVSDRAHNPVGHGLR